MTWALSSFLLLGVAVAVGLAWYERERPPSRVLALVAALAALAVVGRLAFAAIPNVKPTTDIVLFAGYALGAAPGFAVGAITALVSNVFLSPGPVDGLADGGLGRGGRGRALCPGDAGARAEPAARSPLVCGVAGLAFGAWMDLYQWTLAAEQDLDLVHGHRRSARCPTTSRTRSATWPSRSSSGPPSSARSRRYRRRFEVRWAAPAARRRGALGVLLLAAAPARRARRRAAHRPTRPALPGAERRTATAASAARRDRARARSSAAGPRSAWPPRARTRSDVAAARPHRSPPTSARAGAGRATWARSSARCSCCARRACSARTSAAATWWRDRARAAAVTARSATT